jgi:hypothetical protein
VAEHHIEIERYTPPGSKNPHYIAICACQRWRSDPYREREHAESKGLAHMTRGDAHLQVLAAANHGNVRLETVLKYYSQMAIDPFTSETERELWQQMAEELADRLKGDGTEQDVLFD